jgi:hypothetical protein
MTSRSMTCGTMTCGTITYGTINYGTMTQELCKVHKVYMDSTVGETSRFGGILGIPSYPLKYHRKTPRESKRRGQKMTQLIREVGSFMINLGQVHRLTKGFFSPQLSSS